MLDIDAEFFVRCYGLQDIQTGIRNHVSLFSKEASAEESKRCMLEISVCQSSREERTVVEVPENVRK
jgi:hypothetical protein